ncbi:hypothetical protein PAEVO_63770 [Paenibacillus sp. GM2FR]|uniref:hypothetical protein n=1 Tax=Paenibacillus sp. GM2FR TaxID=2059268 RepID=UPI000C273178|nr:hypothetical protein [Paenibacillus sp. GM2FR]PJN48649.1 hypothetical protein PAEVO_63770 [Paenibacillus sp. GM2FR]
MRQSVVRIMLSCLLLLVSLYTVKPTDVFACSCAGPPTVEESLERSAAIFAGKVTKLVGPKPKLMMSSADPVQVTLEVSEVWKGELAGMTELTTAVSSASCGYDQFAVGSEFLVFASAESGQLRTGMCDGTKLLSTAGKELTELGAGYPPDDASAQGESGPDTLAEGVPPGEGQNAGQSQFSLKPVLWGAVVVLLGAGLWLYFWRKRKRNVKPM